MSFEEAFHQCCDEAAWSCDLRAREQDPAYREDWARYQELLGQLRARAGDEELFEQFDEMKNKTAASSVTAAYRQGFFDCARLMRLIGLL